MTSFESAVDAVVAGDAPPLRRLLEAEPRLVAQRSDRPHEATLLHYTAANGVEEERQRTPANVVEIARLLLDAGADANAEANLYGGGATTLHLAATSVHPERAGVQEELLAVLLGRGAKIRAGDVGACLWNGRGPAAEFLAARGAPLRMPEAAGLGRLDEVRQFLAGGVSEQEMHDGFLLGCEYGRDNVVEYLVARGVRLSACTKDGQTGLHMAANGAKSETARLLLRLSADPEALNSYGATALGQARWSAAHARHPEDYAEVIAALEGGSARTPIRRD